MKSKEFCIDKAIEEEAATGGGPATGVKISQIS
jgi:hypothetical protein